MVANVLVKSNLVLLAEQNKYKFTITPTTGLRMDNRLILSTAERDELALF
jgi:hypothetical protein